MSDYIVILGAKVRQDGTPSGSLERRIESAVALAQHLSKPRFLASGGVGEYPPAEAVVIRKGLLTRGVSPDCIILDTLSGDTLESVERCARIILQEEDMTSVTACTDRFHVLRTTVLFRIFGIHAQPAWIRSGRRELGTAMWIYYWIRDLAALFWDVPLAVGRRWREDSTLSQREKGDKSNH